MKRVILIFSLVVFSSFVIVKNKKKEPVTVIITAGQSNTDGRVMNTDLPEYIRSQYTDGYKFCKISKGSSVEPIDGNFKPFWPTINNQNKPGRWAYDAVTYYYMEKVLKKDFYVIKWSLGGTAIDTLATSTSKKYWQADEQWLNKNKSTINGGHSLLLSFEENIATCIDQTLSKIKEGYKIKAFLWHQGESDYRHGKNYYDNLKKVVNHVRSFLVQKTGDKSYQNLPFICGTVSRSNKNFSEEVEAAMFQLQKDDPNFHVIDMAKGELQKDQLHFTAKSAEYLGIEMFNKMVTIGALGKEVRKIDLAN